jgi:hypothetical protein
MTSVGPEATDPRRPGVAAGWRYTDSRTNGSLASCCGLECLLRGEGPVSSIHGPCYAAPSILAEPRYEVRRMCVGLHMVL